LFNQFYIIVSKHKSILSESILSESILSESILSESIIFKAEPNGLDHLRISPVALVCVVERWCGVGVGIGHARPGFDRLEPGLRKNLQA
jgi:hypothetical protein